MQTKTQHIIIVLALLINCFLLSFSAVAQSTDFGAIVDVGYSGKIVRNFKYSLEGEVKTCDNFTSLNNVKLVVGVNYSFWQKRLKASADLNYILKNEGNYYENRFRYNVSFSISEKIRQFSVSCRARVQSTFYEETHTDHKFNPKTYFRNRLEVEYEFFSKPISLYASTEYFLRLYKPEQNFVDNWRTILGVNWRLNQNTSLDFYLRADNEVQVKDRANIYYLGVGVNF